MGGTTSRAIAKKAIRPIKNINVENRAQKTIDRHKVDPIAAPRHPSTKELIEKQVAGPAMSLSEHPEIKEELEKQDDSLINRVNRLHLEMVHDTPKILSKRPLPQSREAVSDPMLALEEPKTIAKGKLSLRQLGGILEKHRLEPTLYQAEVVAKEFTLELQDTINLLKYFEKIKIDDLVDMEETEKREEGQKMQFKLNFDSGSKKPKPS